MNDVISFLKEFGFPAVAFGMMFWLCVVTIANNTKAIKKLESSVIQAMIEIIKKDVKEEGCHHSGEK